MTNEFNAGFQLYHGLRGNVDNALNKNESSLEN